jgi:ubiquinone/menaquinone biosynthesis C-methylase UbiE
MSHTPFTDPALVHGPLYAAADRLARRTTALHAAKLRGGDATALIVALAARAAPPAPVICDIGCGRGSTTLRLAADLRPAHLVALDRSSALLTTTAERLRVAGHSVCPVAADFHDLPLASHSLDVAVAAFCLYHAPQPRHVLGEITRCLTGAGRLVAATKSADSYHQLDALIAASGLDPHAAARPNLYRSFPSDGLAETLDGILRVEDISFEQHEFRFADLTAVAAYVATSPKYHLPPRLTGDPTALAAQLRRRLPDRPLTATSTVAVAVARPW